MFKNHNQDIIKHSNSLEGRPDKIARLMATTVIDNIETFHCDIIQPIHPLEQEDFDYIKEIVSNYKNLNN